MSSKRSSGLANRLAKMAATEPEAEEGAPAELTERSLKVAPVPADSSDDEPDSKEPTGPEAAEATAAVKEERQSTGEHQVTEEAPDSGGGAERVQTAKVLAASTTDPQSQPDSEGLEQVDDHPADPASEEPVVEQKPAPRRRKSTTPGAAADETAVPVPSAGFDLHHLRETMERGRSQRRWVEDNLPHRSERGTFMRLPVHLLDVLDEYCDRKDLPQQDFIAAVLDSYFRDLGALPPLGVGHHPDERFFTELRRQARSRDY